MSRYIDADALIVELQKDEERFDKEADDCKKNSRNYTDCYIQAMSSRADGIRDAIVEVYDAPSIDIEPKRGEWIVYEGGWKDLDYYPPKCKCNQCGYEEELYILNAKPTNFCPNCGADMRERECE